MKKLQLKLAGVAEMLTKEQMKKVTGGYGGCTDDNPQYCFKCCNSSAYCQTGISGGPCTQFFYACGQDTVTCAFPGEVLCYC